MLTKYFLWDVKGKLCSKFGEDRSKTKLTILAVIAVWTDTGQTDAKVVYILSNAVHCIGQTIIIIKNVYGAESGFHDFPGPFMSIFHVFAGLFNWVDIEQVRFSYNTEYATQFIIMLNNRSNRVWQLTMIMYVKAENTYTGQKCGNHLVYFPWFSRPGKCEFWIPWLSRICMHPERHSPGIVNPKKSDKTWRFFISLVSGVNVDITSDKQSSTLAMARRKSFADGDERPSA